MNKKYIKNIPRIYFGIPIIIIGLVIIYFGLQVNIEKFTQIQSTDSKNTKIDSTYESTEISTTNNLFSGPFSILKKEYGINEPVFLLGSGIPSNSNGEIIIKRPDGKIHHSLLYDGSKGPVNHYFTPVQLDDLNGCLKCKFFGIWEISFKVNGGPAYGHILFNVIDNRDDD